MGVLLSAIACLTLLTEIVRSYVDMGALSSTSVLLAFILCAMTVAAHLTLDLKLFGVLTMPLSMLLLLVDLFRTPAATTGVMEPLLLFKNFHIMAAIFGQASVIAAFSISLMYLWQYRNLKKKLISQLSDRVPALDKLSRLLNVTLWVGLVFLTVALISGAYYSSMTKITAGLELKVIWAICVWAWYTAILVLKNVLKKPPKLIAKLSLVGFFILAVSLFGIILNPKVV